MHFNQLVINVVQFLRNQRFCCARANIIHHFEFISWGNISDFLKMRLKFKIRKFSESNSSRMFLHFNPGGMKCWLFLNRILTNFFRMLFKRAILIYKFFHATVKIFHNIVNFSIRSWKLFLTIMKVFSILIIALRTYTGT